MVAPARSRSQRNSDGDRTHKLTKVIADAFGPIFGKPCWNVHQGHGSFLTFEFGEPHLTIRPVRENLYVFSPTVKRKWMHRFVNVGGDWHLCIYCCNWSILLDEKQAAHSESKRDRIARAVRMLNGQALTQVAVDPTDARTLFEFDFGGSLRTWPYDQESDDQWMLF